MKLIYYIILCITLALTLILTVWAIFFYVTMIDEVNDEVDDALEDYSETIIIRALAGEELPSKTNGSNNQYYMMEVSKEYAESREDIQYKDSMVYIEEKEETEPARILTTIFKDDEGRYHELTVSTPNIEKDDLRDAIQVWIIFLYVALLFCIIIISVWVFYRNMRPLYVLLHWLDGYQTGKRNKPLSNDTQITEFRKLNEAAIRYLERTEQMFEQQKQFIGNASHEIQTPLAICRNRLEMLMEDDSLSEKQLEELMKTHQTLEYITKLNKSLLLLSKIDNGQFTDTKELELNVLLKQTEVTEYPNLDKTFFTKDSDGNIVDNYWKGKKLGEIWGFKTVGMAKTDQEIQDYIAIHDQSRLPNIGNNIWKAGDIMYANLDDNPAIEKGTSASDPKDLCIIGNSTPRYRFGITLGADYKGFDISLMFQGVAKRDIWVGGDDKTATQKGMIFWGINGGQWDSTGYEEHWDFFRPEGDELGANLNAYYPRPIIDSKQNQQVQSRYLQNAAYIRLKNLQIGYTLPKTLTQKINLQKVRVFFSGDNLWTGSKMSKNFDPELLYQNGMTYPISYTLSCGINITL